MNDERANRKLTAILSADVKGYSRLMGDDELATIETLKKYRERISSLIEGYKGRVVDSPGDNIMAEFGSVVDAVECAVKIQEELKKENEELPDNRKMEFRIGVNLGDVVEDDGRIYGDGVNIAARIEGLADGGGVCISRTAYDQIKNKISLGYEYIGEHEVKNIAEPVRVYKVLVGHEHAGKVIGEDRPKKKNWRWAAIVIAIIVVGGLLTWNLYLKRPSFEPASVDRMAYPLPDKPSIAVLPFDNMSGDPEQDYIGDGLAENIISALSVSSKIFVMARNASFTYKGTPVKPQRVAEDLGVQYILEGSIQKSGDRLRVTAQFINALSGHHLWTEKYDREMIELFELQDEITKKIVVSIRAEFSSGEFIRAAANSTDNLEAWKQYIKGDELFTNFQREDNLKAREHFKTALKLDPEFADAMVGLGATHYIDAFFQWSDSPIKSLKLAFDYAQKAIKLDENNSFALAFLGNLYLIKRQHDTAITITKQATTLNPNDSMAHAILAFIMLYSGQFDESIMLMKKALRLNPKLPPIYLSYLSLSYFHLGRYEDALEVAKIMDKHARQGNLPSWAPLLAFIRAYQGLGREDEAHASMVEAIKINPDMSLLRMKVVSFYKNPAHLQRELDAYRKAGVPEKPGGEIQ